MDILNTGFESYGYNDLSTKAKLIHTSLGTTPASGYYPTPSPTLIVLGDAIAELDGSIARGNAPGAAEDRENDKQALIAILVALAGYLENTTPGDRAKLATTGYDLRKEPERHTGPTGTPQNVRVKPTGIPGEAKPSCEAVDNAKTYEARATQDMTSGQYATCPPSTSIRGLHFTGLERGKDWYFQIRAISPSGPGPWSDPAMMMVV